MMLYLPVSILKNLKSSYNFFKKIICELISTKDNRYSNSGQQLKMLRHVNRIQKPHTCT